MSLEDRFGKDNENLINKIDRGLTTFHKGIAKRWQDITGIEKAHLETGLYGSSIAGITAHIGLTYNLLLSPVIFRDLAFATYLRENVKNKEKIFEKNGVPKEIPQLTNAIIYGMGLLAGGLGINQAFRDLYTTNSDASIALITLSIGLLGGRSADYMGKSDLKPPKKKKKKKSSGEIVQNLIGRFRPKAPSNINKHNLAYNQPYIESSRGYRNKQPRR